MKGFLRWLLLISFTCLSTSLWAEKGPFQGFIENRGQWHESVQFRKSVPNGFLFMQKKGWTYYFSTQSKSHDHSGYDAPSGTSGQRSESAALDFSQSIQVSFSGSQTSSFINPATAQSYYHNFFLGDEKQWATGVSEYDELWYCDLYDKIDVKIETKNAAFKYDIMVYPGGDPADVAMKWNGSGEVYLSDENLVVETEFGQLIEQKPFSYQFVGGDTVVVPSRFRVKGNEVSFEFPQGYDHSQTLVIDPLLIFSTYSGSTSDNWGNTACFDQQGNSYAGGIIFGASTGQFVPGPGVFQEQFNGKFDVVLMKFDSTGSDLLFATYLGGAYAETPVSLIVNSEDDLVVLGTTSSPDFPTSSNAFENTFKGGELINPFADNSQNTSTEYTNGTDIFVSILSPDGKVLKASTFLGGSENDGILDLFGALTSNYGDQLRGEVNIDENDNVYIASSTMSPDFAMANQLYPWSGGETDGVLLKMNKDLTAMLWGTYVGGEASDALFSVKPKVGGGVYAAGGSASISFPFALNGWHTYNAGEADGLIINVDETSLTINTSTMTGSDGKDQVYLIDLDTEGNVYAVGQTQGAYPIIGNTYINPGSGQFLHKFSGDLQATVWSTVFGSGTTPSNISPTAFLVSECDNIYISGWGGGPAINLPFPYSQGDTRAMPLTADAYQSTTDGNDFYLMVLEPDASNLLYATYFGGDGSEEHVDGGTSRLDKRGVVHHVVCAGCEVCLDCGGNSLYPSTENAWSTTNGNPDNCNLGMFKFDLSTLAAAFSTNTPEMDSPDIREGCAPFTFLFTNNSVGGENHFWSMGDGATSTNPDTVIHTYAQPGEYEVTLTVTNPNTCKNVDVINQVLIIREGTYTLTPSLTICYGDEVQLSASGGTEYQWMPATRLSSTNIALPVASPTSTTTYYVTIFNQENGCTFEDSVTVTVLPEIRIETEITPRYSCDGLSVYEFSGEVTGTDEAFWDFGDGTASTELNTTHTYAEGEFTAQLIASNPLCQQSATTTFRAGELLVPNVFTPNGDRINDSFEIKWIQPLAVKILDRDGGVIYQSEAYTSQWDGDQLPSGNYYYEITLPDQTLCNGWVHLIR